MINIVICGGHLSPALAIIEELRKKRNYYQIFYFGRKKALEGDEAQSLEGKTITKLKIPFYPITGGRLQRVFTVYSLPSLFKFPIGLLQSFFRLSTIKPKVVVSFGGYLALPVCLSAWVLKIPVITHEQTQSLGLANKIISSFAHVLCLSYKETLGIPKGVPTLFTGHLIRESLLDFRNTNILHFGNKELPLIYVTGGSLGSRTINRVIARILSDLLPNYRVLHQCGNAASGADFNYLTAFSEALPPLFRKNYKVIKQLDPALVGSVFRKAQVVIGRAGANTVNEILTFGVPAILIPLPWAGQNEQEKNALLVKAKGLGEVIAQSDLTPQTLISKINKLQKVSTSFQQRLEKAKEIIRSDGNAAMVKLIEKYTRVV